ncbi:MAG: hypothetical protein GWN44_05170 [Calditrichae bacterium]|nr:hypothetical protein [Calditrichia bacterium]
MGTNHPGEIGLLTNLTVPSMGLITNIGKGHIGFFGSLEAIYQEKIALFEAIDHSAPIFLNMEDPFLQNYPQGNRCVIRIGTDKQYEVWGKIKSVDRLGRVTFSLNGESSVHLNIPGQHNFYNALLAAAVGLHFEIGEQKIKQALEEFRPTSQRMEVIEKDGILFINDTYNANPDSMRAAVNYVSRPNISKGKRILVLGDMLELGDFSEKEHYNLGEYIATKPIDYVFLYGPDGKNLLDAIQKKAPVEVRAYWYNTHNEIKIHLSKVLHAGDVVLVKGSRGMAMEKVLESWWS